MTLGRPRRLLTATALCCLLPLAACSGGSTPDGATALPTFTASSSPASPSPTGSPSPTSPVTYQPGDPDGIGSWNEVTAPDDLNAGQQAVLDAWTAYLDLITEAFNTGGENLRTDEQIAALNAVAVRSSQAWRLAFDGAANRGKKQLYTVGPSYITLDTIKVSGNRATLRVCVDDQSYEVDANGDTVQPPPGTSVMAHELVRSGGRWRLEAFRDVTGTCTG